ILEANHPVGIFAERLIALAISAVVTRLFLGCPLRGIHGFQLFLGLVGVVGLASYDQLLGGFAIPIQAMRLEDRAFVVLQAQPVHRLQDGVDRGLRAAFTVGVFD